MISSSTIKIRIYKTLHELDNIGDEWDQLAENMPHKSPLMTYSWLSVFFECRVLENQSWFVVAAFKADQLVAVLPVIVLPYSFLGLSRYYLATPADEQTISVDIVIDVNRFNEKEQLDISNALVEKSLEVIPRSDYFEFYRIDEVSTIYKQFLDNKNFSFLSEYCESGASISVPSNYATYRSSLKKNFRNNLNKARNKLGQHENVKFKIIETKVSDISDVDIFARVEHKCWKGSEGTSIKSNVKTMEFYRKLSKKLAEKKWLRFHVLELEGKVIAMNFAIDFMGNTLLWKLGYDDEFHRYSPGSMLMEKLIEDLTLNNNSGCIDLMTNQSWYDNWNMDRRHFNNYWLFKPTLMGILIRLLKATKVRLKNTELIIIIRKNLELIVKK